MSDALIPLQQTWPEALAQRYRKAGHWRGESFPAFLRERAQRLGARTAVVGGEQRWSYAELWQRAETAAAGFLALGLKAGDRVVVQMGNVPAFYSVVFGLFRAGLVPVYALPAHRITEIGHFTTKSQAAAYVALRSYEAYDYRLLARELRAQAQAGDLPHFRHAVIVGGDVGGDAGEFVDFDAFAPNPALLPTQDPDPQSVAFLQISGGSTGLSKLIPRTHDDYIYSFRASNEICGIGEDSVYLVALPAAHNFPMSSPGAMGAFHAGATVVLSPSPSPEAAFPLIERERVTDLGLVPPLALLWAQAAESTKHDLGSLRVLQVGGAKLTPEAARRVVAGLKCTLQQVFGMAEGLVNYTRLDDSEAIILNTQGRPISPDDEVLIVDDHGQPVPEGQSGYLLTRGPYTIRGYHNDDAANARSFTDDGFYRTGDVVLRTPEGYLNVQGRAHDH
ncbi:MAG: 2,3-dihydroxybenzoate-AMP ligase, partial [Comamonadaceae bacterium]